MKASELDVRGVFLLEPVVHGDDRGWFYELFSLRDLQKLGINAPFVQDNRSYSAQKGTLRGLHCQAEPVAQGKLFTCTRGAVLDVAVDVRSGSPTYLRWAAAELSEQNKRQLWIPRGCLHGFVTLEENTEVFYKVDRFYSSAHDRSIRFDDPLFGVHWGVENPVLSPKDAAAPLWKDAGLRFDFTE
ncbi:MAG: dTDP-4-dehydrorhamnose 3,5-epimerase [Oscillospiraceae bacterium]|jgi:dTDP-4-dehydrorhamnose 3,5-epimerase|nr:dTDP-4-dehydrorhamnose 3,5-epimerase [Oscillospiraceae bacterium]